MKDQGAIGGNISDEEKYARAKALFICLLYTSDAADDP